MKKGLKYMIYFLIFSIFGFLIEYIISPLHLPYGRGLYQLFSIKVPFNPLYGFGGILLFILEEKIYKKNYPLLKKGLLNGLFLTLLEFLTGIFFLIMDIRLWDYSSHFMNVLGLISLRVSSLWILLGLCFAYIYPWLKKV